MFLATSSSTWRRSQTKLRVVGEPALERGARHVEHLREPGAAARVAFEVLRDRPDRGRRNARREDQAVAVEDPATAGGQLDRVAVADLALLQEEGRVDDLDVDRAAEQGQEAESDQRDEQLRAPRRRRRGEQRAGRVAEALDARRGARPWRSSSRPGRSSTPLPRRLDRGRCRRRGPPRTRKRPSGSRRTASSPASRCACPGGRAPCARRATASPAVRRSVFRRSLSVSSARSSLCALSSSAKRRRDS